jgi:FHS family L-fucose permease-like MFS transporter
LFLYVGAEVSIGSLMVSYLMQPKALSAQAVTAGRLVAFYWGGAMVGRLIGSGVMLKVPAAWVLSLCALGAATLALVSAGTTGWTSAGAIIAIGLCNSVMFPTIFSLAIDGLGERTPQGSGLVCMAIVGGAIVPLITGAIADHANLSIALLAPVACYLGIAIYGALTGSGRLDSRQGSS